MVRYADDFVILCRSEAEARQALERVQSWTATAGLQLHPTKTRIVDATQAGGFDFLGYHFEQGQTMAPAQEPGQAEGHDSCQDPAHQRAKPSGHHHEPEPDAARLVWIFQTQPLARRFGCSISGCACGCEASCANAGGNRDRARGAGPSTLAECLLRGVRVVLLGHSPCDGPSILWEVKPPTGEPDAGDPPVRFGGRGNRIQSVLPTPIVGAHGVRPDWTAFAGMTAPQMTPVPGPGYDSELRAGPLPGHGHATETIDNATGRHLGVCRR